MFWLIYVTMNIKNVLLWLECRLIDCASDQCRCQYTLCSTPTRASIRFCLKSSTSSAFSARLAGPYFEINVLRSGLQGCSVDRNLEVHTSLLHYCTFGLEAANDAQNVRADIARGKYTSRIYQTMIM